MSGTGLCIVIMSALLFFVLWLYGLCVLGCAYSTMIRKNFSGKYRKLHDGAGVCAFFSLAGGLILGPVLLSQKRRFFAIMGFVSILCYSISLALNSEILSIQVHPYLFWGILLTAQFSLIIAISGYRDRHKLKYTYLWPLVLLVIYIVGLRLYHNKLDNEILHKRAEISKILGRSIELKDFWTEQKNGMPTDVEPLKSLIALRGTDIITLPDEPYLPHEELKKNLDQWKAEHPQAVKAINEFLKVPVQKVGHQYTPENLAAVMLSELNVFRDTARYLCYELAGNCNNRKIVLQRNAELEKIRDWALNDDFIMSKIVAIAVERLRLQAMTYPLRAGSLSSDDWKKILNNKIDWNFAMADGIGDEATTFQSIFDLLFGSNERILKEVCPAYYRKAKKFLQIEIAIHFKRDYIYALSDYKKDISYFLSAKSNLKMLRNKDKTDKEFLRKNFFVLSAMMLSPARLLAIKVKQLKDYYRLVETAVKIEAYRKGHGKLPESLDFLPKPLLDSINGLPVIYKHGNIKLKTSKNKYLTKFGFRLYFRDETGKEPKESQRIDFTVVYPQNKH